MILRLAALGAVHGTVGVAIGLTGVLAACTVAQVAKKGVGVTSRGMVPGTPVMPREPMAPTRPKA
ncbi:hypothetical protein [Palleronia abyssalis]|uniref:Lipoprotein n=1 Tax=Palleronia abyssalis TaxID=1501240 RepID=A0A2R8BQ93_9RHOB|nr:hypothetical protein [Palleronia abyssalis]SPJ22353.1 hypothetical protein PAA8504_00144 [Palleronia abyssalis]